MVQSKSIRILKNFCTSDKQFFIKFWLPTFSTMRILNPKVGTVPRKFEYLWTTNRPRHLFCNEKLCFHFAELLYKYKNYLKTVKRENILTVLLEKSRFFFICIELF